MSKQLTTQVVVDGETVEFAGLTAAQAKAVAARALDDLPDIEDGEEDED